MRQAIVGILLLAAPVNAAFAQELGSPARGLVYAKERCADCHAVDLQTKTSPVRSALTFNKIANTPGMTPMALTAWLHSSHDTMPNLIVRGDDLSDLIAYIRSLKTRSEDDK